MISAQAVALIAAGRLLQSKTWYGGRKQIRLDPGGTYPQAVARMIAMLAVADRDRLREVVAWVLDYEREERTQYLLVRRQTERGKPVVYRPSWAEQAPTDADGVTPLRLAME